MRLVDVDATSACGAVRQEELAEPAQFCEMVVTGAVEEAGEPARRAARFPALHPHRLAAALQRYRELDAQTFSLGRHPRMPKVPPSWPRLLPLTLLLRDFLSLQRLRPNDLSCSLQSHLTPGAAYYKPMQRCLHAARLVAPASLCGEPQGPLSAD